MRSVAHDVASLVRKQPRGVCFGCLARAHRLPEHDVRSVAVVLITPDGLQLVRRTCSSCRRTDELLAVRKAV